MDDIEQQAKLRDYAFKVLSFRPRSCHEIKQKLDAYSVRKKFPENLVGKVIAELLEKNFLNDEEFALWWKEQRSGQKAKGYRLIKIELQQKGIPSEIIEKVLMQDQKSQEQELASALALVNKKSRLFAHLPKNEAEVKIANFLMRRGFNWSIISKVIDSVGEKAYN